jgi:hypothetical protein
MHRGRDLKTIYFNFGSFFLRKKAKKEKASIKKPILMLLITPNCKDKFI